MDATSQEDARKARTQHWSVYPVAKARRIDNIYKTMPTGAHVRDVMIDAIRPLVPCGRVLDVGCGTGYLTISLHDAGYQTTGLDVSNGMLEVFKENAAGRNIGLIFGDIFEMQPPAEKFDAVTCRNVFSHYPDFGTFLKRISDYVVDGGHIIFDSFSSEAVDTAAALLNQPADVVRTKVFGTLAHFSRIELEDFCAKNGMQVIDRYASAFFHRNPLFATFIEPIADYDAQLVENINNPEVKKFMSWFQASIASKLPSTLSGSVINIIRKSPT
ncbi:class I SAM-dependent methyltransferase [Achromobacter spanius]